MLREEWSMARSIPKVREGSLQEHVGEDATIDTISIGTVEWFTWLEQHHSFTFETPRMTFTARREQRPGGWYWYAYRRILGKLRSAYLGKSEELTLQRLNAATEVFEREGDSSEQTSHQPQQSSLAASLQTHHPTSIPFPLNGADSQTSVSPVPQHNLPIQVTSLVGREAATATATALLRRPEVRLLCMIGTGGIGKTRLAIEVATELLEDFTDGVTFVALAPLRDPDMVLSTITNTLGLQESGSAPATDSLHTYLRDKRLLLVLDNFEHLMPAAPVVGELLTTCPNLKLLVTSREVLHLRAEQQFSVPPLAVPDRKHVAQVQSLTEYPALELFLQRARAVKHDFQLQESNAQALAEICTRLDGLPLAIELAAARIGMFSPQALLARLDHRLQVLTHGHTDLPERQQTLRKTIQWSYGLLRSEEQRLFRQLSVFVGGCTLQAITAVCTAFDGSCEAGEVLEGIASLIDKSLVQQTEQQGQEPRLVMLETIREYGLECLHESGEIELVQSRHARYFLTLVEEREPQYFGTQAIAVQDQLEREFENLRAAMKCLAESGEQELALRLAGALWWFWYARGHLSEGHQWYEQLLGKSEGIPTEVRAQALVSFGWVAYILGDNAHAGSPLRESLSLYRQLGNKEKTGVALHRLGLVAEYEGDFVSAQALQEEALQLFTELEHKEGIADSALALSYIHFESGDYLGAHKLAEQAVMLFREIDDQWGLVTSLLGLARTVLLFGDERTAQNLAKESLALSIRLDDKYMIALCLEQLAEIAVARDELERAAQLWGAEEALEEKAHAMGNTIKSLPYEKMIAKFSAKAAYHHPGEQGFAAARAQGRALTPEQVLAALESVELSSYRATEPGKTPNDSLPPTPDGLTPRETDVLLLLAQGLTSAQIAEHLILSRLTVNTHVRSIYSKLGVTSRSSATRWALEHKLV
jgi:predicted ATPase/DNA-binding CsgD family transcriptional regulator